MKKYVHSVKRYKGLLILSVTLAIVWFVYRISRKEIIQNQAVGSPIPIQDNKAETILFDYFRSTKYKDITPYLIAQAKVESDNFTSNLFRTTNNAFGMNCVKIRPTSQYACTKPIFDGGKSKAMYRDVLDSGRDMILWLEYNKASFGFQTVDEFAKYLKSKNYYEVSLEQYTKSLKSWM